MSGRSPIWRSILWVERFLPAPIAALPEAHQAAAAKRRAAFLPLVVMPLVMMPIILRNRHELGVLVRENIVVLQQAFLGFAVIAALAVVVAGVVTWRREAGR